jgi:hypothetical protein
VGPATTEVLAVSGFAPVAIQAVTVNGTVEAPTAPWELPGSLSYRVVAAGAHAGLRLESHERLSYNAQSFAKDLMLVAKGT